MICCGTVAGVGTYMLSLLEDLYPSVYRFAVSVFPSADNDVITSPYNSVLATNELIEHAHCVFPVDNHALQVFSLLERSVDYDIRMLLLLSYLSGIRYVRPICSEQRKKMKGPVSSRGSSSTMGTNFLIRTLI